MLDGSSECCFEGNSLGSDEGLDEGNVLFSNDGELDGDKEGLSLLEEGAEVSIVPLLGLDDGAVQSPFTFVTSLDPNAPPDLKISSPSTNNA